MAVCIRGLTHMSKLSFQYGFNVFLITLVVRVCSPLMVATAKGSGKPAGHVSGVPKLVGWSRLTENIALVEAICGDNCSLVSRHPALRSVDTHS